MNVPNNNNQKFIEQRDVFFKEAVKLVGTTIGVLKIIDVSGVRPNGVTTYKNMIKAPWVKCECQCEKKTILWQPYWNIKNDIVKSCGCLLKNNGKNRAKTVRRIKLNDWNYGIEEWATITGIPRNTIYYRYNSGKGPHEILDNPNSDKTLGEMVAEYEKRCKESDSN